MRHAGMIMGLIALTTGPAQATNSPIELRTAMVALIERLSGQFDSAPQVEAQAALGTPEKERHGRVYRSFTRIDAPALGDNVLVATVRYGGKAGQFDNGEFQVWTVAVDAERKAVRMSPRRFKDPDKYKDRALDAAAFAGLAPSDLVPASGAASCDIYWRLYGQDLRGASDLAACKSMSTATKTELAWDWQYVLSDSELWLTFAGRDASGKIASGRADQAFWRLGKARAFECLFGYRPKDGEPQSINGPHMHDRGDVHVWQTKAPNARTFHYELLRADWPARTGRGTEDLLRIRIYDGDPTMPQSRTLLGEGWASAASDRASFGDGEFNGRCKLFDPGAPPPKNE
ncbi:MAG: hypothetical protein SFV21_12530 [Rhodospirillaceae bacterium]|nr:hypothetical protein [Rhodospirillaceae bacterium]